MTLTDWQDRSGCCTGSAFNRRLLRPEVNARRDVSRLSLCMTCLAPSVGVLLRSLISVVVVIQLVTHPGLAQRQARVAEDQATTSQLPSPGVNRGTGRRHRYGRFRLEGHACSWTRLVRPLQ